MWELLYTNSPDLLAVLAIGYLPLSPVKIGAVIQVIDSASGTVENKVRAQRRRRRRRKQACMRTCMGA